MNRYQFMTLGSLGLAGTALYRAHACKTEAPAAQPFPEEKINFERLCSNLTRAIQIPTVSCEDEVETDWAQFEKFRSFLREAYPRCFSEMEVTEIAGASLLLFLPGSDPSLDPIGFCAHQDVVPVPEDTVKDWKYPPYSGHNDGAFIYGRGAIDMKNHLLSLLEAVESLLEEGYQPKRGLYLMFGHNEEIVSGRSNGAEAIAAELERRGVHLDSIVDEGGAVFDIGRPDLLDGDIAAIGIAEKGYCDVKITVAGKGGHSSRPPKHSAIGELSKKIVRLENHPFRGKMPDYLPPPAADNRQPDGISGPSSDRQSRCPETAAGSRHGTDSGSRRAHPNHPVRHHVRGGAGRQHHAGERQRRRQLPHDAGHDDGGCTPPYREICWRRRYQS